MSKSQGAPAQSPEPAERRVNDRYSCNIKSSCKPIEHPRSGTPWPAQVKDVSASGVRLVLCRRFEPGTLLAIEVQETTGNSRLLLARVVRVVKQRHKRWVHGCALDRCLEEQDLENLVESPFTAWVQEETEPSGETSAEECCDSVEAGVEKVID